jgi:hypothetical protein
VHFSYAMAVAYSWNSARILNLTLWVLACFRAYWLVLKSLVAGFGDDRAWHWLHNIRATIRPSLATEVNMRKLALVSLSWLLVSGLHNGALASQQCGCAAECSAGFVFHAIGKACFDKICRTHADDHDCTIVCSKKDDQKTTETKTGICYDVYYSAIGLKLSPRGDH